MPKNTWFGFGLGSKNMDPNTDMIQIDGGSLVAYDVYAVGKRAPAVDVQQDIEYTFEQMPNDKLSVTLRRALDTGDFLYDYIIPVDTQFDMSWALNTRSSDISSQHQLRGAMSFTVTSKPPIELVNPDDQTGSEEAESGDELVADDNNPNIDGIDYNPRSKGEVKPIKKELLE